MGTSRATATLQGSVIGLVAGIITDLVWQQQAAGWVSIIAPLAMGLSARLLAGAVIDRLPLVTLAVALATYWIGVLLFPIALAISGVAAASSGGQVLRFLATLYAWTPAGLTFALPTVPAVAIAAIVHVWLIHRRTAEQGARDDTSPADTSPDDTSPGVDRPGRFRRRTIALAVVTVVGIGIGAGMISSAGENAAPATSRSVSGGSSAG